MFFSGKGVIGVLALIGCDNPILSCNITSLALSGDKYQLIWVFMWSFKWNLWSKLAVGPLHRCIQGYKTSVKTVLSQRSSSQELLRNCKWYWNVNWSSCVVRCAGEFDTPVSCIYCFL